ncbi:hypothetical protein ANO14919_137380 [Xylariales sp. No.14919]|nr:hypothetical protein ANO14919_137380 [Xylariales sp. No.14919]
MQILFTSKSDAPTILHKSWEHAFRIFWTVQSSLCDPPMQNRRQDSDINMSLQRGVDNDGAPEGPWKSDRSELEAVLGLWLWSLKKPPKGLYQDMNSERVDVHISRILSSHQDQILDLDFWRERGGAKIQKRRLKVPNVENAGLGWDGTISCPQAQNSVWWKDDEAFVTDPTGPREHSHDQRRFFGWYNISDYSPCDYIDIWEMTSENSLLLNCAQEMYCIFLTAITEAVENIGDHTMTWTHEGGFTLSNDNIDEIIRALITRGLCDAQNAFACVIPILRQQNKLEYPMAGDLVDRYRRQRNWGKTKEFTNWMIRHSYDRLHSSSDNQDSVTTSEVANDLRLCLVQACELYRQALLQNDDEEREFGCEGILELLERYSQAKMIINMAATWVDSGTAPPALSSDNQNRSLADVIWSYGEAMMWCMAEKPSRSATEGPRWRKLKGDNWTPRQTPNNLFRAITKGDLSSTLYLLQRHHLTGIDNIHAFAYASDSGWWMVVEALIKLGAAVNHEDDNTRNALSYASQHGDINMVRVLLKNGALATPEGLYRPNRPGALYYAAKQGHPVIIRDILDRFRGRGLQSDRVVVDNEQRRTTPLSCGIRAGNPAVVEALIHGASENELNDYHTAEPVLHLAIAENQGAIVDVLLKNEAVDINFNHSETIDSPPLVCAVRLRNEPIFEKILNSTKVDADCPDAANRTALWWAAALGLDSYVTKLLASGKVHQPAKEDRKGDTALSISVQLGHLEVVRQLRCVQQPSTVGVKAILIAAKNGHTPVVEELFAYNAPGKEAAEQLLQRYGLQKVWVDIQNSKTWDIENWETWDIERWRTWDIENWNAWEIENWKTWGMQKRLRWRRVRDKEKNSEFSDATEIPESELSYASEVISAPFNVFKRARECHTDNSASVPRSPQPQYLRKNKRLDIKGSRGLQVGCTYSQQNS